MTARQLNELLRPFHENAGDQLKAQAELNEAVTSWLLAPVIEKMNEAPKYCEQYAADEKVPDDDAGSEEWGTITHPRRGFDNE